MALEIGCDASCLPIHPLEVEQDVFARLLDGALCSRGRVLLEERLHTPQGASQNAVQHLFAFILNTIIGDIVFEFWHLGHIQNAFDAQHLFAFILPTFFMAITFEFWHVGHIQNAFNTILTGSLCLVVHGIQTHTE